MNIYMSIYEGVKNNAKNNIVGQIDLFGMSEEVPTTEKFKDTLPDMDEYPNKYKLSQEKEILGFYVSGNPLDKYWDKLKRHISRVSTDFPVDDEDFDNSQKVADREKVQVAGFINSITLHFTKNNKVMAFLNIEDMFGTMEIIVFPDSYDKFSYMLKEEEIIVVKGTATIAKDQPSKVICEEIRSFEQLDEITKTLWLKVSADSSVDINNILDITTKYRGNSKMIIYMEKTKQKLTANAENYVTIDDNIVEELKELLGNNNVVVK